MNFTKAKQNLEREGKLPSRIPGQLGNSSVEDKASYKVSYTLISPVYPGICELVDEV